MLRIQQLHHISKGTPWGWHSKKKMASFKCHTPHVTVCVVKIVKTSHRAYIYHSFVCYAAVNKTPKQLTVTFYSLYWKREKGRILYKNFLLHTHLLSHLLFVSVIRNTGTFQSFVQFYEDNISVFQLHNTLCFHYLQLSSVTQWKVSN